MIRNEWPLLQSDVSLDAMHILSSKLRLLKEKVRVWTKEENLRLKESSKHWEEEISSLLHLSQSVILAPDLQDRLNHLKADYKQHLELEVNSARLQS